ncbi:MAG: hypothetical protein GYA43_12355 [Bacteroidales bacterium]|nr:hypothetical protein [Bacteroidales bacterium]
MLKEPERFFSGCFDSVGLFNLKTSLFQGPGSSGEAKESNINKKERKRGLLRHPLFYILVE